MHAFSACLLPISAVVLLASAPQGDAPESADLIRTARQFVELLEQEEYSRAVEQFDATMTKVMPPEKLEEAWTSTVAKYGPFKRQAEVETAKVPKFEIVVVTCEFEKSTLDVKVVFDGEGRITGLWFTPSKSSVEYKPPAYVKLDSFEEKLVRIGAWPWTLPGTLSLPKASDPLPAVVLVHGSGPHDRDETIGPNKPFRDLAWGLASRGIAVLRYEKRTKEHPEKLLLIKAKVTVKQETIDDVLAAVSLLRQTDGIDAKRVFVLGHSLGGMLVPRFAALDPEIAGFIVFAGTTRPLEDVFLEQVTYVSALDGNVSDEEQSKLDEIERQVARVKDPKLSADTAAEDLPFGVPAAYWLDLRGYDPPQMAKTLKQPMLILQAGRDYQVTMEDYQRWQRALSGRDNVQLTTYPKCNHLFIEGDGKCTPAEYQLPGHVAEEVVEDIARWVLAQPPAPE